MWSGPSSLNRAPSVICCVRRRRGLVTRLTGLLWPLVCEPLWRLALWGEDLLEGIDLNANCALRSPNYDGLLTYVSQQRAKLTFSCPYPCQVITDANGNTAQSVEIINIQYFASCSIYGWTCYCNGTMRLTNGVTTYTAAATGQPIQCVYNNFLGAPSSANGPSWSCQCSGTLPTCTYTDPIAGNQQLYAQNYSLTGLASNDPFYSQTSNAVHRAGTTIYYGDVYGPPAGAKNVTNFPGFSAANSFNFGANDGGAGTATGGNYVIIEGLLAFPSFPKTISLKIVSNQEFYGTLHLAQTQNGSFSRDPNDWQMVMRQKSAFSWSVTYDSGIYSVPSCAFGQWVSFALVVSDGAGAYQLTLQWSLDGAAYVDIPQAYYSSPTSNPIDSDCRELYCVLYVASPTTPTRCAWCPLTSSPPVLLTAHGCSLIVAEVSHARSSPLPSHDGVISRFRVCAMV